jgi:hypothetical protein
VTVVRQLAQAVLLAVLLGCLARLLHAAFSDTTEQQQPHSLDRDNEPTWVRDQRGGGVLPGGDVGGDTQVSESFSVRFHHRNRPGAMVTYCYYAAVDPHDPMTISLQRQTEYLVCTDPTDPGGTEVWSANSSTTLQPGFGDGQAASDAAHHAAQGHLVCDEPWSGRSPWESE